MRGTISREHPWEVMPDLYFYRDPEEVRSSFLVVVSVVDLVDVLMFFLQIEKEEQAAAEKAVVKEEFQGEWSAPPAEFTQPEVSDWSEGVAVPSVPIQQFPAGETNLWSFCFWSPICHFTEISEFVLQLLHLLKPGKCILVS